MEQKGTAVSVKLKTLLSFSKLASFRTAKFTSEQLLCMQWLIKKKQTAAVQRLVRNVRSSVMSASYPHRATSGDCQTFILTWHALSHTLKYSLPQPSHLKFHCCTAVPSTWSCLHKMPGFLQLLDISALKVDLHQTMVAWSWAGCSLSASVVDGYNAAT